MQRMWLLIYNIKKKMRGYKISIHTFTKMIEDKANKNNTNNMNNDNNNNNDDDDETKNKNKNKKH